MGSVLKRGKTWYIKYELPRGADGQRKPKMQACPGMTKKEAEVALAEIERQIRRGEHATSQHTVASYLQEWLDFSRPSLAISTAAMYRYDVKAHLIPELGEVKLNNLTPLQIQRFYQRLAEGHSRRPLSNKSIRNIHGLLHKALSQAVRWGLLSRNPVDLVEPPKAMKASVQAVSQVDLQRLLSTLDAAGEWRLPILIALFTGMRRGEVLGLQWQDYNPDAHTLVVQRSLSQFTGQVTIKSTKTERARVVLISPALVEVLDTHMKASASKAPSDFICHYQDGRPACPQTFFRALYPDRQET